MSERRPDRMYEEEDLLPLSGLQHLAFCERQCALIHVERQWRENRLTAEGRVLHERVDASGDESRGDLRILRGVEIRSLELGLVGKADVVELRRPPAPAEPEWLARFPGSSGRWQPVPVEYKRGRPKLEDPDRIQVCAQALCLEEMLRVSIPEAEIFYGTPRRRSLVDLTDDLRERTRASARRFHEIVHAGETPVAVREPKCRRCSLLEICLPPRRRPRSVAAFLDQQVETPE